MTTPRKMMSPRVRRLLTSCFVCFVAVAVQAAAQVDPDQPPEVTITSPGDGATFALGDPVAFVGTALDPEDGDLTAGLVWTSDVDGPIGSGGSFTSSTLSMGTHTITAQVVDSGGLSGAQSVHVTITAPVPQQLTFLSLAAEDGDVEESAAGSAIGGLANAGGQELHVGDHTGDEQFKAILSFDTSAIPDDALIQSATILLRREGVWGSNPFDSLGPCWIDVESGGFGGDPTLEADDFQASATAAHAGTLSNAVRNGDWSTGVLDSAGLRAIKKTGRTQIRLAFELPTNGNGSIDRILYDAGDQADPAVRPELVVTYVTRTPTVIIAAPGDGAAYLTGEEVTFQGQATDAQDGDLTAGLTWTSDVDGPIGTGGSFTVSSLTAGDHVVTATVTDSDGLVGSQSVRVTVSVPPPPSVQVTFQSVGAEDGDLIEEPGKTGLGAIAHADADDIQVGDHLNDAQVKGLVSFDTSSIPDDAVILSATLRLQRVGVWGINPFDVLGPCSIDIRKGAFGNDPTLAPSDFEASATTVRAGTLSNATRNGDWSTGTLNAAGLGAIDKTGTTQLRLSFDVHDNGNQAVDRILYGSGDEADPTTRPQLVVTYAAVDSGPRSSSTTTSTTSSTSTTDTSTTDTSTSTTSSTSVSSSTTTSITATTTTSTTIDTTTTTAATSSSTTTSTVRGTTTTTTTTAAATTTTTSTTPPRQMAFRSNGAEDGFVVESSPGSGRGGVANVGGGQLRAGDNPGNRQVKAIVSFDTSAIPDGATIISATLRLRRGSVRGGNPYGLGTCSIDVEAGAFGGNAALEATDFQAPATAPRAGVMTGGARKGDWSTGALDAAGLAAINKAGTTQLRLAFPAVRSGSRRDGTIGWSSGNRRSVAVRPELIVTYVD